MRRILCWVCAVMLTVLAGALILAHLHLPSRNTVYHLSASSAAFRTNERMAVSRPNGGVAVNRAGLEELETLPGVGPAIAQRILDEREENGLFHYPEDLLTVRSIGIKTLEKIRSWISMNK